MTDKRTTLTDELNALCLLLPADFAAVARFERERRQINWLFASGSLNGRYRLMTARPGVGIAGHVIRYGCPVIVHASQLASSGLIRHSPLMLAERLQSAIAAPIVDADNAAIGVLLAGARSERDYGEEQMRILALSAARQWQLSADDTALI